MKLYGGTDLHANNNYLGILDEEGHRRFKKRLPNQPQAILEALELYKPDIQGIVVESTFNWYWYVDMLMDNGYKVYLANPCAIQQYKGLKHSNDKHDAFWLAEMLRLGILPTGYIYPKEDRPVRDLLRKRRHLVRLRTSLILSLQNIVYRNYGFHIKTNDIKRVKNNRVIEIEDSSVERTLALQVSKESIDFLGGQIRRIENAVLEKVKLKEPFEYLHTIPGVGNILALTIMLETGAIGRFEKAGNYTSYCRKVSTNWTSNGKVKGKGNKKNGNRYLAWAFSEAAEFARRHDERVRAWYNRKAAKTKSIVAHSALASKLSRATWYMMKNCEPFDPEKLFA